MHTAATWSGRAATVSTADGGRGSVEPALSVGARRHARGAGQAAVAAEAAVGGVATAAAPAAAGHDQALSGHVEVRPATSAAAGVDGARASDRATVSAAVGAAGAADVAGHLSAATDHARVGLAGQDSVGCRDRCARAVRVGDPDRTATGTATHRGPHGADPVGHRARVGPGRVDGHRTRDRGGTRGDRLRQRHHHGGQGQQARGGDDARQTAATGEMARRRCCGAVRHRHPHSKVRPVPTIRCQGSSAPDPSLPGQHATRHGWCSW